MTLRRSLREPSSGSEESQLSAVSSQQSLSEGSSRTFPRLEPWRGGRANWSVRQDERARAYRQCDRRRLVLNPPLERAHAPNQPRHFPWHFLRLVETVLRTRHSRARQ